MSCGMSLSEKWVDYRWKLSKKGLENPYNFGKNRC